MTTPTPARALLLATFAIATATAAPPTQATLDSALATAEAAWATPRRDIAIVAAPLNSCHPNLITGKRQRIAWSDFATRTITINSNCNWDTLPLEITVTHEVGHMLTGPEHSIDRHSVMFAIVSRNQHITDADRIKAANSASASSGATWEPSLIATR